MIVSLKEVVLRLGLCPRPQTGSRYGASLTSYNRLLATPLLLPLPFPSLPFSFLPYYSGRKGETERKGEDNYQLVIGLFYVGK